MDPDLLGEYVGQALTYGVAVGFVAKLLKMINGGR